MISRSFVLFIFVVIVMIDQSQCSELKRITLKNVKGKRGYAARHEGSYLLIHQSGQISFTYEVEWKKGPLRQRNPKSVTIKQLAFASFQIRGVESPLRNLKSNCIPPKFDTQRLRFTSVCECKASLVGEDFTSQNTPKWFHVVSLQWTDMNGKKHQKTIEKKPEELKVVVSIAPEAKNGDESTYQ